MSLERRKIKFKPRIKLTHNIYAKYKTNKTLTCLLPSIQGQWTLITQTNNDIRKWPCLVLHFVLCWYVALDLLVISCETWLSRLSLTSQLPGTVALSVNSETACCSLRKKCCCHILARNKMSLLVQHKILWYSIIFGNYGRYILEQ